MAVRAQQARLEEAMARRRDEEARKLDFWKHTSKYFSALNSQNDRFSHWNSAETLQKSQDAFNREKNMVAEEEAKEEARLIRRNHYMDEAKKEFEAEMRLNRTSRHARAAASPRSTLHDLRNDYERLQMLRYERQQKESEEKMLQHWRINNPEFREMQFKRRTEMAKQAWDAQLKEAEAAREKEEKENEEAKRRLVEEQRLRAEKEREEDLRREQQVELWKQSIEAQREELAKRQKEEQTLKAEIALENQRQKEVFQAEIQRKAAEEKRTKDELGAFLKRQHRIKLLERNKKIQDELEEDKKILEQLQSMQAKEDAQLQAKEKESRTKQLEWLKDVLAKQKVEEEKRRKEMDLLFTEEARKMWDKQEKVWNQEKEARKKLMEDVLKTLAEQTQDKLKLKEKRSRDVLQEKQSIQEEIKKMEVEVELEERKAIRKQEMFVQDLDDQVQEKAAGQEAATKAKDGGLSSSYSAMTLKDVMVWEQKNRDKNELAQKLTKVAATLSDDLAIADFRRKKVKW